MLPQTQLFSMTLGRCCVKKPTEAVFHNALKLYSCEKIIIILSLKYHDVDSKIFNKLFQCRRLSNDRESQCIRSTEICLSFCSFRWPTFLNIAQLHCGFYQLHLQFGNFYISQNPTSLIGMKCHYLQKTQGKKQRTMQSRNIK